MSSLRLCSSRPGKRVDLGPWRGCDDTFVGPSIDDAITAFRAEQRFMNDRYDMPMWAGSKMENGNTGTETAGGIRVAVKRE